MSGRTTRGTKRKLADVVVPAAEAAPAAAAATPPAAVPEAEVRGERKLREERESPLFPPYHPPFENADTIQRQPQKPNKQQIKRLVEALMNSISRPVLNIDRVAVRRLAHQLAEYCKRGEGERCRGSGRRGGASALFVFVLVVLSLCSDSGDRSGSIAGTGIS